MDRFLSLQVFVQVAQTGGFGAAARKLHMSPPAVTRAISALEERIGTRLFVRTTRSVRLTESGQRFLEDSKRILEDLKEAENAAIGMHTAPQGEIKITAPVLFGRLYITPILSSFLKEYPQMSAQTLFLDRVVNLMDEGMDIAVRIGPLADSSMQAIKVGEVEQVVFASPDYLQEKGVPHHPEDLKNHEIIVSSTMGSSFIWHFQHNDQDLKTPVIPRVRMNTNDAVITMVQQGFGISRLFSYQVNPLIRKKKLTILLEDFAPQKLPVHILHLEGRMVSTKIRACVDYLVERLRSDLKAL